MVKNVVGLLADDWYPERYGYGDGDDHPSACRGFRADAFGDTFYGTAGSHHVAAGPGDDVILTKARDTSSTAGEDGN